MTMYTIQATQNPVHDFVHDFKVFVWHLVAFYNITKIANSFVFNGGWYCAALCGMMGFRASLSANNLKLSAKRWAFFVQGRQELAPVRTCAEKAQRP